MQVNGEMGNLTPEPIVTKSCIRDYVMDIYPHTKFSHDPSRGFFSHMHKVVHQKCLLGFFFSRFFQRPTAQARELIFMQNTSNDVVPCKDVSFRVSKKIYYLTLYFRKTAIIGPPFDRTKLSVENCFRMGMLHVNSP